MKFKTLLITGLLATTIGLVGCGKGGTNPDFPTIDWNEKDYVCKGGSYGGFFAEINIERQLCVDSQYDFVFESSLSRSKEFTVKSSNTDIAEAVKDSTVRGFYLNTKAQGDLILTIENADGVLVYRNIVRVRNAISLDDMDKYLQKIDKFVTPTEYARYYGSYRLTFEFSEELEGKLVGTLKGGDDYDPNVTIMFTMEFDMNLPDRDCYSYKLTTVYTATQLTFIEYLNITRCGDWMYMYEDEVKGTGGLLTMLVPSK